MLAFCYYNKHLKGPTLINRLHCWVHSLRLHSVLSWPHCFGSMMVHLGRSQYQRKTTYFMTEKWEEREWGKKPFCKSHLLKFHSSALRETKTHGPEGYPRSQLFLVVGCAPLSQSHSLITQ